MGDAAVTIDEVKIRDLSRPNTSEWTPPIGAMGGPPAHELYRDLVAHGGLRLMRDRDGNPWVEMQDGERRRSFRVPGVALRGALDRFRMRRNLRPAPETDLEDFARVVSARVSDPDVRLPVYDLAARERAPPAPETLTSYAPTPSDDLETVNEAASPLEAELARVIEEVDAVRGAPERPEAVENISPVWQETPDDGEAIASSLGTLDPSISGGRREPAGSDDGLPRYLRVLRGLASGGGWLGTLGELGRLTREDPDAVFGSLLKYHAQLTQNHLVVAPVEVEDGWRWLVVDRTQLRSSNAPAPEVPEAGIPGAPAPESLA
jgi:hypothetical protein